MPVRTICKCGARLRGPDHAAGKRAKCPSCGEILTMPELTDQPSPPPKPQQPVQGAPSVAPTKPRQPVQGKRQRMYLFERAYVDLGAHIRTFGEKLLEQCKSIWPWFWQGPGSKYTEMALRVLVVISGVVFGVMYVNYENAHGRGFGLSTIFSFALIAGYVSLLMWGWKAPVHISARATSGVCAMGSILVLGSLGILAAIVVFLACLLALMTLTALSFLLFLPMRAGQEIYLLYRHITYRCPYDDCPSDGKKLPIHICECGAEYKDLKPSFYGIFHHTCRHGDEDVKLPTMDILGRNKLQRKCAGCGNPLIHSSIGDAALRSIFMVGGTGSGKTVFLTQAIRNLCDHFGSLPGGKAYVDSKGQKSEIDGLLELLDRGELPAATAVDREAFGVVVNVPKQFRKSLLYLYDSPGESFQSMDKFSRKRGMRSVAAVVLLVDPFSLKGLTEHRQRLGSALGTTRMPLETIAGNLAQLLAMIRTPGRSGKFDIPLAVVISKADALPTNDHAYLDGLCPTNGETPDTLNTRCRQAINRMGGGNAIRALEQNFSDVRYFACSALGRMPDAGNRDPFQPIGVTEPFLWTLGLDDSSPLKARA